MDCLIGTIKKPEDKETREKGVFIASSLDCGISVLDENLEGAAKKLANLLIEHIKTASDKNINPYVHDEEAFEELMLHCTYGMPKSLPDIDLVSGLRLRCYDLTN